MITLDLKNEEVGKAIREALLATLSQEVREKMIAEAIAYLVTEQERKAGYEKWNDPAPIQQAFNRAVEKVAREVIEDEVANNPEFLEAIRVAFRTALQRYIQNAGAVNAAIADAIVKALKEEG